MRLRGHDSNQTQAEPIKSASTSKQTAPSVNNDERLQVKDLMRPAKYGGHSKRDQLGSIAESWGSLPSDTQRTGLFQHEPEPPSPAATPAPALPRVGE